MVNRQGLGTLGIHRWQPKSLNRSFLVLCHAIRATLLPPAVFEPAADPPRVRVERRIHLKFLEFNYLSSRKRLLDARGLRALDFMHPA